jgi:hypothetical protein
MLLDETPMATLTIRNIDAALNERSRVRAVQHGHSMEAEVRDILQASPSEPTRPREPNRYGRIRARFAPYTANPMTADEWHPHHLVGLRPIAGDGVERLGHRLPDH